MFEDNNRNISDGMNSTADTNSEKNLEADTEEQKNSRYSHKIYKTRAALAVVFLIGFLIFQNWGTLLTVANYVGGLFSDGISNSEGITYFPEDYGEIYVQIQKLNGDGSTQEKEDFTTPEGTGVVFPELNGFYETGLFEVDLENADVICKQGKYIYAVDKGRVYIISSVNGKLSVVSEFSVRNVEQKRDVYESSSELFVTDDYLIVVDSVTVKEILSSDSKMVKAYVYDISDRSAPVLYNTIGQSGEYLTSWMVDDCLYIISKHTVRKADKARPETYVPLVYKNGEGCALSYTDVCIYNNVDEPEYTVITGIDMSKGGKIVSNKALLGYGSSMYINEKSLYVTSNRLKTTEDKIYNSTDVTKFVLNKGEIKFKASANVPGFVVNKAGMSENDNSFRMVTLLYGKEHEAVAETSGIVVDMQLTAETSAGYIPDSELLNNEYVTCIYTLDSKLEIKGALEDIFPGEPIYKTKFVKDTLYLKVGEEREIYTVDLTDDKNIKIKAGSESGYYPEYLTAYSENDVIGIVKDEDGDTFICMYSAESKDEQSANHIVNVKTFVDTEDYRFIKVSEDTFLCLNNEKCVVIGYSEKSGFKVRSEIDVTVDGLDDIDYYKEAVYFIDEEYLYIFYGNNKYSFVLD